MSAGPASSPPEFDPARLDAFLRSALPGRVGGAMTLERISGGQSNPTFFVSYPEAGTRLVLRKKPPGPLLPSAHAVDREYRILKALAGSDVPVPPVLLFHGEDDVVGTPFYLMERLDGPRLPRHGPARRDAATSAAQMYFAMAETLAALHRFDWQAAGLADFGKPGNYYARQLARWGRQWRETKTREIPAIDRLIDWLGAHLDETRGDHDRPRRFPARQPDVRTRSSRASSPCSTGSSRRSAIRSRTSPSPACPGIRRRRCMPASSGSTARRSASRRRPSISRAIARRPGASDGPGRFHLAFSLFRFAVILDGIAARAKAGNAAAENAVAVGEMAESFRAAGRGLIDGSD